MTSDIGHWREEADLIDQIEGNAMRDTAEHMDLSTLSDWKSQLFNIIQETEGNISEMVSVTAAKWQLLIRMGC